MKTRVFLWVGIALTACFVWFLLFKQKAENPLPTSTTVPTNAAAQLVVTNPVPSPPARPITITNKADEQEILKQYRQGTIGKGQVIIELEEEKNAENQDFYGRVIDQYGQPVVGASVTGVTEVLRDVDESARPQAYRTESDTEGLFQFTGVRGWRFNVTMNMQGYLLGGRGEGYKGPAGEKTSPNDRAIFTMWKLRGPEPLTSYSIDAKIPFDGSPVTFDMATGKAAPNGDLRITLSRSPLQVRRSGQGFDWSVKIEMLQGGLIAENDPYPYWAPDIGYQQSSVFNASSNDVAWQSTYKQDFYIKSPQGQYGRMQANIYTTLTPARIYFDFTINSSGSQNLEPALQ